RLNGHLPDSEERRDLERSSANRAAARRAPPTSVATIVTSVSSIELSGDYRAKSSRQQRGRMPEEAVIWWFNRATGVGKAARGAPGRALGSTKRVAGGVGLLQRRLGFGH